MALSNKVIIADDEEGICFLMQEIASDNGFEAHLVYDGRDFEKIYLDVKPLIVFLDICLPGKDGPELIKYLGHQKSQTKVVVMSGMDMETLQKTKLLAEQNNIEIAGILQKPASIIEIEELFNNILAAENIKLNKV